MELETYSVGGMTMPAFEPEVVDAMGHAYDVAVTRLAVRDPKSREAIASKIVAAATAGESDPAKLYEKAVA
jgi:hypothetical protein